MSHGGGRREVTELPRVGIMPALASAIGADSPYAAVSAVLAVPEMAILRMWLRLARQSFPDKEVNSEDA